VSAYYLLRLDDACHTMDRSRWDRIETLLDAFAIRPIVAVVPDNRDPDLCKAPADSTFWERVRRWQAKGWTLGMHGYRHQLHETDRKLVLPFYRHSEFAGLPYEEQAAKMRAAWALFEQNGLSPRVWIAPAHCFEEDTLRALKAETPIRIVSDGIALDQFFEAGLHWLPQQLWTLAERRKGLWTVCLHPGTMDDRAFDDLARRLHGGFDQRITSVDRITLRQRAKSLPDKAYSTWFWTRHRTMPRLHRLKEMLLG